MGGDFLDVDGVARQRLAKVGTGGTGVVDPTWNPSAGGAFVRRLLYDGVGEHVYVAGAFFSLNGNGTFRRLARVSATGTGALDTTWFPNPNTGTARGLVLDAAGWLYFSGSFNGLGGNATFRQLARTNVRTVPNGAPDPAWKPNVSSGEPFVGPIVYTVGPLTGGGVLAGGFFAQVGGLPRPGVAAIGPDLDRIFSDGYEQ
jgi:hypothetical protein